PARRTTSSRCPIRGESSTRCAAATPTCGSPSTPASATTPGRRPTITLSSTRGCSRNAGGTGRGRPAVTARGPAAEAAPGNASRRHEGRLRGLGPGPGGRLWAKHRLRTWPGPRRRASWPEPRRRFSGAASAAGLPIRAEPSVEPAGVVLQALDAVLRLAVARHAVALVGVAHQLDGDVALLER